MFFKTFEVLWGVDIEEFLSLGHGEAKRFESLLGSLPSMGLAPGQILEKTGFGLPQSQ